MDKFTVIITHYKQMNYIKESVLSVLNQEYRNIELIIADDGSPNFDKKKVEGIIKKYNKKRFEYKILDSKKNVGTVKNLNRAVKEATGNYILFFAADDKLYDTRVINKFVEKFKNQNINVITSQCLLYDENLKKLYCKYVNPIKAFFMNKKSTRYIYYKMACGCLYGSGGTAYRNKVFKDYGFFDEKYPFVEDWSYWLKILRQGEKIYYYNFNTLCHRDGGISHSEYTSETLPAHVKQYYKDILNIYNNEIFPFFNQFKFYEKYKILIQYQETALYYSSFSPDLLHYLNIFNELKNQTKRMSIFWKITLLYRNFNKFIIKRIKILLKYNKTIISVFIIWLLFSLFLTNKLSINNNYIILLYILSYFIIYIIMNFIGNTIKFIKHRKTGGLNV